MTQEPMSTERNADIGRDRDDAPRQAIIRGPRALPAERLEQIRERIREGAYDSQAVREATARGILGRGEL
jgi:hypothetical protein